MMSSLAQDSLPRQDRIRRYILLLAGAEGGVIRNRGALQKMLYVVARTTGDADMVASFVPGEHGPHSEQASDELARMSRDGLLSHAGGEIAATSAGREAAGEAGKSLGEYTRTVIAGHGSFLGDMTDEELLLYTHLVYPSMTANSRECIDLARRAEEIVMGMVRDEKISSGRAAEVLALPFYDMLPLMKKHGIPNMY